MGSSEDAVLRSRWIWFDFILSDKHFFEYVCLKLQVSHQKTKNKNKKRNSKTIGSVLGRVFVVDYVLTKLTKVHGIRSFKFGKSIRTSISFWNICLILPLKNSFHQLDLANRE